MSKRALPGIGFVLTDDDPFTGVDLDACRDPVTGELTPESTRIVTELDSYAEVSPSGTGVRIILAGSLPDGTSGRRKGKIEVYAASRFLTLTGHRLPGASATVNDRQTQLEGLLARVVGPPPAPLAARSTNGRSPAPFSDGEIIERACGASNGDRFRRLYFDGDVRHYGDDDSAADLALCAHLAFWTQDEDQIDRLFRRSALCRPKWVERADYRARTITKALAGVHHYEPADYGPRPSVNGHGAGDDASPPAAWEPPVPLADHPRPPFPTDVFPPTVRAFVEALGTATQTPAALPGLMTLAALATAAAKHVAVCLRDGWVEPVNLYTITALDSGNRKSAVVKEVTAPLREFEREKARSKRREIAEAENRRAILEEELKRARRQAASTNDADYLRHREETDRLARDIAEFAVPKAPRLLADDCTPEKLAALMADNGGRMAVLSPEGGIFDVMAGRFSKDGRTPNLMLFLMAHAGDDLPVDRMSRPGEYLTGPALTLGLTTQTYVLRQLANRPDFRGTGLLARLVYGLPESYVGRRRIDPPPMPDSVRAEFWQLLRAILTVPPLTTDEATPQPRELTLSSEADVAFTAFRAALEPRLGPDGDLAHVADWGGKLAGLVGRIAGLLHTAIHAGSDRAPWEVPIASETMAAAIRLGETFILPHALAAFGEMGADPAIEAARDVARVLERWEAPTVSRRDLHQRMRRRYARPNQLDSPLSLLVEHGYLRPSSPPMRAEARGRKASDRYEINPRWERAQNSQNTRNSRAAPHSEYSVNSVDAPETIENRSTADASAGGSDRRTAASSWNEEVF